MIFKNYPLTYCLHPTKYYNKYLQQDIVTPCGHCEACRTHKSNRLHNLIDLHSTSYKYSLFVTLKYNQTNIPKAKLYDIDTKTCLINEDGVILSECDKLSEVNKTKLYKKVLSKEGRSLPYGVIPYLDSHDLRLFMVRLRQRISTKFTRVRKTHDTKQYRLIPNKYRSDEKFTYYAIGEYGPKTFRPHFHILFFFNESETLQALERHIYKAWQMGYCDIRLADNNVSSYVSSYVASSMSLPKIYDSAHIRPFYRKSLHFAHDAQADFKVQIIDFEYFRNQSFNKIIGGQDRSFFFTHTYQNTIYPKITGFGQLPVDVLFSRYKLYSNLRDYYANLAKIDPRSISIKFLIYALKKSFNVGVNPKPMHDAALDLYNFDFSDNPEKDKYTVNSLYKILLTSKLFCKNYSTLQLNPYRYVLRIIDYWSYQDLNRLNYSLSNLEQVDDVTQHLYYEPLTELSTIQKSPLYQQFSEFVQKEAKECVKHKEQNDINQLLYDF